MLKLTPATPVITELRSFFPTEMHNNVYVVGGTVRDLLCGVAAKDIDLAAALDDEDLKTLGFRQVSGKSTVVIWFRHDAQLGNIEVIQLEHRDALAEDLARRDFTINAMAIDLEGNLIDPCKGVDDIAARRLRPCFPATIEADPLRIFRAFRFSSDNWGFSEDIEAALRSREWNCYLEKIPVERFSREMLKSLGAEQPERFFQSMLKYNAGQNYLPELFRMSQVPAGPLKHHPEGDLLSHCIQVLQRAASYSKDPLLRFCAFFHDIGKLATAPELYPKHHGHDKAGYKLAIPFCDRLRLPAGYRTALAWTSRLHTNMNRWDELRDSKKLSVAEHAIKSGITRILPIVSAADKAQNGLLANWNLYLQVAAMSSTELGIDPVKLQFIPHEQRAEYLLQFRLDTLLRMAKASKY